MPEVSTTQKDDQLEKIDEQLKALESLEAVNKRLKVLEEGNQNAELWGKYAEVRFRVANVVLLAAATLFLLVFTPIGDLVGFKAGWVAPESAGDGAQQVNTDAIVAATRNMITVIAPIVLGIVIWMITITAERRLKTYDETMQNFRGEIRDGMAEARDTTLVTVQGSIKEQVRDAIETEKQRMDALIDEYRADLQTATERVEQVRQGIENRFGHIADTTAYAQSDSAFGELTSVGAVHKKVSELFHDGDRAQAVTLVREMLDLFHRADRGVRPSGSLKGDWFNLSAVLGNNDEEGLALEVCLAGLQQQAGAPLFDDAGQLAPGIDGQSLDDDVLAHAIQYAQTVNDRRLAALLHLNGYDPEQCAGQPEWGWRSYAFTIKALDSLGRHDEAIKLGHNFLKTVPLDADTSKVVQDLMAVMAAHGDRDGAVNLALTWLDKHPYAPGAQVITQLLDWLDTDTDVDRYIALASRGIRDLAEEQASSNMGNFYYRRALARDKRALDAVQGADHPGLDICNEIKRALADYEMARDTDVNPGLFTQIAHREKVLRRVAQEHGCDEQDLTPPGGGSGGSGPSGDPSDAVRQQIVALLPIITNDGMSPTDKAQAIKQQLSTADTQVQQLTHAFLDHMKDDDDTPDELRAALREIWPHL